MSRYSLGWFIFLSLPQEIFTWEIKTNYFDISEIVNVGSVHPVSVLSSFAYLFMYAVADIMMYDSVFPRVTLNRILFSGVWPLWPFSPILLIFISPTVPLLLLLSFNSCSLISSLFSPSSQSPAATVVCFRLFPLSTTCPLPSLKSLLYNLSHSLPSLALLCAETRQMLRFNALIWLAGSPSISLILVHLVPSKTLWSNLGKMAFAQTERGLCCLSVLAYVCMYV